MFRHSLRNITEQTLAYISDCPMRFTLNLLFEYDDDLSNMTSSFICQSESSLNISSLSEKSPKSEAPSSAGSMSSPSSFGKKKPAIIM